MVMFSKAKTIVYPQRDSTLVYINRKDNNNFMLDQNLWNELDPAKLVSLSDFFKNVSRQITLLISDDIIVTKSFIYETKIEEITKKEVSQLAQNQVAFTIDESYLDFKLDQQLANKTIIRAQIGNPAKLKILFQNITKLNLEIEKVVPVSEAIASVFSSMYSEPYFLIFPENKPEATLLLARGSQVFLTAKIKGSSPDVQKIVNYSSLYFQQKITKLFQPENCSIETSTNPPMQITPYQSSEIAKNQKLPINLPLPVLGIFCSSSSPIVKSPVIIKESVPQKPPMENKKNILPVIFVFIGTALIASAILWFIVNRNSSTDVENPSADITPTFEPVAEVSPTETPIPSPVEVSKKLKIQVLNATEINGQAAKVKQELVKLGFSSVTVGNSTETATKNELRLKTTSSDAASYFQQKLTGFDLAQAAELPTTSSFDVVVVIGEDLSLSPTKTITPSTASATPKTTITPTTKPSATPTTEE